jgi:hypothetical protein
VLSLAALVSFGCGANEGVMRSGRESPTPPAVVANVDPFEREMTEIKEAKFTWLYVVRRRDGGILNSEDKAFVRQNTADANRRVMADGGKAVSIGSNYSITADGAQILKQRFEVTDLSTPPAQ